MRIRQGFVVASAVLLGAVGCGTGADSSGGEPAAGHSVFSQRPADQLVAAGKATKAAGSVRFTSTRTWTHEGQELTDLTTGDQSFRENTAHAARTVTIPAKFPAPVAKLYADTPGRHQYQYGVQNSDVLYRTTKGSWLRYPSQSSTEFSQAVERLSALAGSATPYGGTLADMVFSSFPKTAPTVLPDGHRRYRLNMSAEAGLLVPAPSTPRDPDEPVVAETEPVTYPATVELDEEGRLAKASLDLSAALKYHVVSSVRSYRIELTYTDYGVKTGPVVPQGQQAEDATKVLTSMAQAEPGSCGSTDTGLDSARLLRTVDCSGKHDVRVYGKVSFQQEVAKSFTSSADDMALDRCDKKFGEVPAAWTAEARPTGRFHIDGSGSEMLDFRDGSDGAARSVEGSYTCYVRTS